MIIYMVINQYHNIGIFKKNKLLKIQVKFLMENFRFK
jgi:hypothetical protein